MHKLPNANRSTVAIAAHAESHQRPIGQHCPSGNRRHAPMHRVKTVGAAHEVSRTLRRATDTAQLCHTLRLHAHFVHGVDNALGNRVMTTASAKSSLAAAIVDDGKANPVHLGSRRTARCRGHLTCPPWS